MDIPRFGLPMRIAAKTEYACVAVLQLAAHYGERRAVCVREIADEHGIAQSFLLQLLALLKKAGLVTSTRGSAGGFALARPPEEISLGEVMAVIDGDPADPPPAADPESRTARVLRAAWDRAAQAQSQVLHGTTLAELLERVQTENMYYI
jgi:Rrf2 family protein